MLRILVLVLIALLPVAGLAIDPPMPRQYILICVSDAASPAVKQAAAELANKYPFCPQLSSLIALQPAVSVRQFSSEAVLKNADLAAFNHLVVVGLPGSDPLLKKTWEHYASVNEAEKRFYAQGWGYLQGDIGYIESDRNPFLHTRRVKTAPFETELIKITGTSEAGVLAAVQAFLKQGWLNAVVPAGNITRPQKTILDLDPYVGLPALQLPVKLTLADPTGKPGDAPLAGWTQAPANEYRAFIDMAGFEPVHLWRAKYLAPHALDRAKTEGWMAGYHRMAYGNTVSIAEFATADAAQKTAEAIGKQGGWRALIDFDQFPAWQADQPTDENMAASYGKVIVTLYDRYLIMSTLTKEATVNVLISMTHEY